MPVKFALKNFLRVVVVIANIRGRKQRRKMTRFLVYFSEFRRVERIQHARSQISTAVDFVILLITCSMFLYKTASSDPPPSSKEILPVTSKTSSRILEFFGLNSNTMRICVNNLERLSKFSPLGKFVGKFLAMTFSTAHLKYKFQLFSSSHESKKK